MFESFINMVNRIRSKIKVPTSFIDAHRPNRTSLSHFTPISQNKPIDIMSQFKCSSGPVDIMPAKFIYSVLDAIVPWLFTLINLSLSSCCVPDYMKTACIQPLLKNPGLDLLNYSNYRLISRLPLKKQTDGLYHSWRL